MSAVDVDSVLATLERTPAALRAMLAGLPADLTHATEGGESWSPQFEASQGNTVEDL